MSFFSDWAMHPHTPPTVAQYMVLRIERLMKPPRQTLSQVSKPAQHMSHVFGPRRLRCLLRFHNVSQSSELEWSKRGE